MANRGFVANDKVTVVLDARVPLEVSTAKDIDSIGLDNVVVCRDNETGEQMALVECEKANKRRTISKRALKRLYSKRAFVGVTQSGSEGVSMTMAAAAKFRNRYRAPSGDIVCIYPDRMFLDENDDVTQERLTLRGHKRAAASLAHVFSVANGEEQDDDGRNDVAPLREESGERPAKRSKKTSAAAQNGLSPDEETKLRADHRRHMQSLFANVAMSLAYIDVDDAKQGVYDTWNVDRVVPARLGKLEPVRIANMAKLTKDPSSLRDPATDAAYRKRVGNKKLLTKLGKIGFDMAPALRCKSLFPIGMKELIDGVQEVLSAHKRHRKALASFGLGLEASAVKKAAIGRSIDEAEQSANMSISGIVVPPNVDIDDVKQAVSQPPTPAAQRVKKKRARVSDPDDQPVVRESSAKRARAPLAAAADVHPLVAAVASASECSAEHPGALERVFDDTTMLDAFWPPETTLPRVMKDDRRKVLFSSLLVPFYRSARRFVERRHAQRLAAAADQFTVDDSFVDQGVSESFPAWRDVNAFLGEHEKFAGGAQ